MLHLRANMRGETLAISVREQEAFHAQVTKILADLRASPMPTDNKVVFYGNFVVG